MKDQFAKFAKLSLDNKVFNYITVPIRKSVVGFKDKVVSFLRQMHLNKQYIRGERN